MSSAGGNESNSIRDRWSQFGRLLATQVDGASLAVFRICFGLIILWWAIRHLWPASGGNRVYSYFTATNWNFPYPGFEWVRPLPEPGITLTFVVLAAAAFLVTVGVFYRAAAVVLFFAFTYTFLIEQSRYNNHYYLICLLALLLACMPASRCFSIESWWSRRKSADRDPTAATIPLWPVFVLRAQIFIIYFYAGLPKLSADWLSGQPLKGGGQHLLDRWQQHVSLPFWPAPHHVELFIAWAGTIFDLSIGFLLLFRRTRLLGILLVFLFHLSNHFIFEIGVFPFLGFSATLIFLDADWPRRLWTWLKRPRIVAPDWRWLLGGAIVVPVIGAVLGWSPRASTPKPSLGGRDVGRWVPALVAVWIVVQCLIPLRHHLIEGRAEWTEIGQRFSWRMMLRSKQSVVLQFDLVDSEFFGNLANSHGRNWEPWPAHLPRAAYVVVDAGHLEWQRLPEVVTVHEPCVGTRLMVNPESAEAKAASLAERQEGIAAKWRQAFHREPNFQPTQTLEKALDRIVAQLERHDQSSLDRRRQLEEQLENVQAARKLIQSGQHQPATVKQLSDALRALLNHPLGNHAHAELSRVHPFAIQGCAEFPARLLVVEDEGLMPGSNLQTLAKFHGDGPYVIFVDPARMSFADKAELPEAIVMRQGRGLRVLWNPAAELSAHQVNFMSEYPCMIHQYANHIADAWQVHTGRRPEIHVTSLVSFNHRQPQPMIDRSVDLARVPLKTWGHNDWIVPDEDDP